MGSQPYRRPELGTQQETTMGTRLFAALAAAGLMTAAHAQSSVTLFGIADVGIANVSTSGAHRTLVQSDGNTSSRLGFRGQEDLGGGLYAAFWLEGAIDIASGAGGTTNAGNQGSNIGSSAFTFGRRSTVSLGGRWGELRIGRDYVPTFSNLTTVFTPFGTNGMGNTGTLFYPVAAGGTTPRTNVRASNSVGYHLPSDLGGFYGTVMVASGNNPSTAGAKRDDGNYRGARIGWRGAGFNIAAATGHTDYATGDYTQSNVGVSYEFHNTVKLMYLWGRNKVGITQTTAQLVGIAWDVGPGEFRAEYARLKAKGVASDATHTAIGYVYNLSKRTAIYTDYAIVDNKGAGTAFDVGIAVTTPGGTSRGFELGIRHAF
jgi:predicted porin